MNEEALGLYLDEINKEFKIPKEGEKELLEQIDIVYQIDIDNKRLAKI
jgi:hypothetical protein